MWFCGGGVVWFFTDYDATPIKVVLHCFGLLVGLCQMDISRRLPNLNNQREFGARVCKDGLDHLPNPLKVLRKVSGNLLNLPPIKRQRAVQTLCSDQIKDLGVRTSFIFYLNCLYRQHNLCVPIVFLPG